jgi:carbonic anhydrase
MEGLRKIYEEKKPVPSTQNNGHTIMTTYEVQHYIELDGTRYNLVQFHFHYLSEHLINGKQYPMELHLVHRSDDGKLAVLGVFIEEGKQTRLSKKPGKIYPTQRATHTVRRALWI